MDIKPKKAENKYEKEIKKNLNTIDMKHEKEIK